MRGPQGLQPTTREARAPNQQPGAPLCLSDNQGPRGPNQQPAGPGAPLTNNQGVPGPLIDNLEAPNQQPGGPGVPN